ncbi:MAG: right-handed parallel beta-helix repeat-containing protein [Putridiphycobacter sp.]|nr:right-handed parallel beta-helix repeat-containing protein [Putridiphycobacter sp.]
MKQFLILIIITSTILSCQKKKENETLSPGIIENKTFHSTVLIDGHDFDGTIIRNCIFEDIEGDGLQIRDVDNLCIEDCIFKNISEDAIRFRNSGTSNHVKISRNEIYNIEQNGILAPENHINTVIDGNLIYQVATNNAGSQFGSPHHGIYFQGINVTITNNTIYDILNDQGNCVSIRTYGTVAKNILYNATDHGISYFSDHPGNGQPLLIENNFIFDNGKRGINLTSNGISENHIGSALVRFNTILSHTQSPIGTNIDLEGVAINIIGNILIRTDGASTYIFSPASFSESYNITASGDLDFIDFVGRNFHIKTSSSAVNAAIGANSFPASDFDGQARTASSLDVGADEI